MTTWKDALGKALENKEAGLQGEPVKTCQILSVLQPLNTGRGVGPFLGRGPRNGFPFSVISFLCLMFGTGPIFGGKQIIQTGSLLIGFTCKQKHRRMK